MNDHAMKMVRGYTLCLFAMPKWLRFLQPMISEARAILGQAIIWRCNAASIEFTLKGHSHGKWMNGKWRAEIATLTAFSCSYRNANQVEMQPVLCDITPWVVVVRLTREGQGSVVFY